MGSELEEMFEAMGALWRHSGDASQPHAILTSGAHSDGYFNGTKVVQLPHVSMPAIFKAWEARLPAVGQVDWVFGSAMGAITLASHLAEKLQCKAGYTEKVDGRLVLKRFDIRPGDAVLVVEDTITSGKSTKQTLEALEAAGAEIFQVVFCIADRSFGEVLFPCAIESALQLTINTWEPDECPLCAAGSEALRPKGNWDTLVGNAS